jgi:hypothetical protein
MSYLVASWFFSSRLFFALPFLVLSGLALLCLALSVSVRQVELKRKKATTTEEKKTTSTEENRNRKVASL